MKISKWILPALAAAMFVFSLVHTIGAEERSPRPPPPLPPTALATSAGRIAGTGMVEPAGESILVGAHRAGVVSKVLVRVGDDVREGAPLFCLDARAAEADVAVREADLQAAKAGLVRLQRMPRQETIAPVAARLAAAEARLAEVEDRATRTERLVSTRAASEEEGVRTRQMRVAAARDVDAARAELDLVKAGTWAPDLAVAQAAVAQAAAQLARVRTELDLLCVNASIAATVLKVEVRPGEFVATAAGGSGIVLGRRSPLHVRVDFDENDIPRVSPARKAVAIIRGRPDSPIPLTFVRLEPLVVPKRSLTGASTERIDTRVLQAVYSFDPKSAPQVFVGQQADVYVDADVGVGG
jgi:multidrug resistance efflux pump